MQANGLGAAQVAQVRGFADQHLRNPQDPTDATNRRISVIVKYLNVPQTEAKPVPAPGQQPPAKGAAAQQPVAKPEPAPQQQPPAKDATAQPVKAAH